VFILVAVAAPNDGAVNTIPVDVQALMSPDMAPEALKVPVTVAPVAVAATMVVAPENKAVAEVDDGNPVQFDKLPLAGVPRIAPVPNVATPVTSKAPVTVAPVAVIATIVVSPDSKDRLPDASAV
jgi:hypothetical protein